LGLVGGLGVGATIHYYQTLVTAHGRIGRVPALVMVHADVGRVLADIAANNLAGLADYLAAFLHRLAGAGADLAALTGIAPHVCLPQLIERAPLPLVDLVAELAEDVRRRGLKRVSLFGTRFAMETRLFGQLPDIDVVLPRPDELAHVHATYLAIVARGAGTEEQARDLTKLARTLCARDGVETIILAGTELSLLFSEATAEFPAIDAARVHIDAIMRRLCGADAGLSERSTRGA
jgi:aspartate racemase